MTIKNECECECRCAPHGVIEINPSNGAAIRTYLYRCINAVSFLNDDTNGMVIYVSETDCKHTHSHSIESNANTNTNTECKVWFVSSMRQGGSGRSELITVLKNQFEALGLSLIVKESVGIKRVLSSKQARCRKENVGERMGSFRVRKFSRRLQMRCTGVGACTGTGAGADRTMKQDGNTQRYLTLTRNGFLLELDGDTNAGSNAVVSCRPLADIANIVRNPPRVGNPSQNVDVDVDRFTIEYKGGLCRTYTSTNVDKIIVSLLDVSVNLCKNFNVTVTDVPSGPYCMKVLSVDGESNSENGTASSHSQNLFQLEPLETICLRKVHRVSTVSHSYIDHIHRTNANVSIREILSDSIPAIECCREFNANALIQSVCRIPNEKKFIEESINGLWGICSIFLEYLPQSETIVATRGETAAGLIYAAITPIFQTLYRLMLTEVGFSSTATNEEIIDALEGICCVQDPFTLYWSMKCLSALLLPRPFAQGRDKATEVRNKSILLHPGSKMPKHLIDSIEKYIHDPDANRSSRQSIHSDLVLMVCSNVIESLLCSHHDTTSLKQRSALVEILSTK